MKRTERIASFIAAMIATALALSIAMATQELAEPSSRAEAIKIVEEMRRIVTPEGIERASERAHRRHRPVDLGARRRSPQPDPPLHPWRPRGTSRCRPVGTSSAGWEEYFTVVQWDQRERARPISPTIPRRSRRRRTSVRMVADAEEMIGRLRKEFGKSKIFVLGHSWGSYLGLTIAQRHPEWLHAYIGMGQMTNMPESERRGWRFAMDRAREAKNESGRYTTCSRSPHMPKTAS